MKFSETKLSGAFVIEIEKIEDERGFFARIWDNNEFKKQGLSSKLMQCSVSFNKNKGTLRGMHFQKEPFQEVKIVKCIQGKIFDVIIDLRVESRTYKKWFGVELSADKQKMIYVPEGFAHGFQTLEDNTHVLYQMSNWFSPEHEKGIRWDDKDFNIKWPITNLIISKKDLSHKKEEY